MATLTRNGAAFVAIASAVGVGPLSTAASAQTIGDDFLEFGAEVDLRYDSNVVRGGRGLVGETDAADYNGSDIIITPALTASINKTLGSNAVRASVLVGYDFYLRNERLGNERIQADLAGVGKLAFCELRPGLSFQRRQARAGERGIVTDPAVDVNAVQTVQDYRLDASCGRSIGIRAIGGVEFSSGRTSSEFRRLSDYDRFTYYGGIGYQQPSIGKLDLYASNEETEYVNSPIEEQLRDYSVRRYGATFSRDINARWNANVGVFYVDVNAASAIQENYSGLGWNIGLNGTFPPRLQVGLQFGKDVQPVLNNDSLYTKQTLYGVSLNYALNERWNLSGAYSLRDRNYVYSEVLPPSTEANLLEDQFNLATVSATYNTASPLSFSLYGGYEKRSSNTPLFNYDGVYGGVTVKYLFRR